MSLSKEQLKEMAINEIDKNRDNIIAIGDSIFYEPELGYKEFKTAEKVKKAFDEIGLGYRDEVGVTGVVAELKGASSKMKVAVMGEMDAVITKAHAHADPETGAAHTCGHNCMVAALVGVSYALKNTEIMKHLDGDVALMAVPAEEYVEIGFRKSLIDAGKVKFTGGKQEFIYLGEFDDVDIALMEHNGAETDGYLANGGYTSNGFLGKLIRYVGKAAHAGGAPHLGVNALNAANIGLMAINAQRETFMDKDTIRVHPIITKGGDLVNVVPDDVTIETYIRGSNVDAIFDANMKVDRALKAGGDAVGAQTEIVTLPGYLPLVMCDPLMELMVENQKQLFGEDKVQFRGAPMAGSTDAGDLSHIIPTLHCGFGGVSGTAHAADYEISNKDTAYVAAAKGLAMTVIDLLYDGAKDGLKIKEDFEPRMTKEEFLKDWGKV